MSRRRSQVLIKRLGCPRVIWHITYLVSDSQFTTVKDVAARHEELRLQTDMPHCVAPLSGALYIGSEKSGSCEQVYLFPMSWADVSLHETLPLPGSSYNRQTLSLASFAAAQIRILRRKNTTCSERTSIFSDLLDGVVYHLFDMSYEGDYMEIPGNDVPLSAEEVREIENASKEIRDWKVRPGEEWIKEAVVRFMTGSSEWCLLENHD